MGYSVDIAQIYEFYNRNLLDGQIEWGNFALSIGSFLLKLARYYSPFVGYACKQYNSC